MNGLDILLNGSGLSTETAQYRNICNDTADFSIVYIAKGRHNTTLFTG